MPAFSIAAIALYVAAAGTTVSTVATVKAGNANKRAGKAQRAVAESQADLADYNASVVDLQAQDALERGMDEEGRFRAGVRAMVGAQRAGFAGAGVDVGFGSAVDVQADAEYLGELDALQIRTNAGREAWGYKVEAYDLRRRAEIARKEGYFQEQAGNAAASASRWAAAGTIAGGAGSLLQARYGLTPRTRPTAAATT